MPDVGLLSVLWLVVGVLLAAGLLTVAGWGGPARVRRVAAIGLAVASLIYVGFAAVAGDHAGLHTELLGFAGFGAVALAGGWRWPWLLVIGWVVHVGWDVGLHLLEPVPYVGTWYPTICIGFDLVVAGGLSLRLRSGRPV